MAKKEISRKLGTTGKTNSYFVIIPKDVIRNLNWRKGQRVVVEQQGKRIVIEDWRK